MCDGPQTCVATSVIDDGSWRWATFGVPLGYGERGYLPRRWFGYPSNLPWGSVEHGVTTHEATQAMPCGCGVPLVRHNSNDYNITLGRGSLGSWIDEDRS